MLINDSISQQRVDASYNAIPQNCPISGSSLPIHTLTPTLRNHAVLSFQLGLPVRAQYRFFVDLYGVGAAAAALNDAARVGKYLGHFEYTVDAANQLSGPYTLFLPLVTR